MTGELVAGIMMITRCLWERKIMRERERERERKIYFSDVMNNNSLLTTKIVTLLPFPPISIQKPLYIMNGRIEESFCPSISHNKLLRISDVNSVNFQVEYSAK